MISICLCFLCFINFGYGSDLDDKKNILSLLYNNNNWELEEITDDAISIYSKQIDGIDILGLMVNQTVSIKAESIRKTLINIDRYSDFIREKSVKSVLLEKNSNFLNAYQSIEINIPFIKNRQYWFRMFYDFENPYNIIEWS